MCSLAAPRPCSRYPIVNRALIRSLHLKDAFAELSDLPGAANINITFSPTEPYLRIGASGSGGSCYIDFPQASESFVSFAATATMHQKFHLSLLQLAVKALSVADETFVRLNDQVIAPLVSYE